MLWKDVLNFNCFVLNMDKDKDRLDISLFRIKNAGFTNVKRFAGIDASIDDITDSWKQHGSPSFAPIYTHPYDDFPINRGRQCCALGHYNIWTHIINNKIPYSIIFEDDVEFHKYWDILAPEYWKITPKDFDILYLGSQILTETSSDIVLSTPLYCTHAYIISLSGAHKLYDLCIKSSKGTYTIDNMLIDYMRQCTTENKIFIWYAWKARLFHDSNAYKNNIYARRNSGLVFQDANFESNIGY